MRAAATIALSVTLLIPTAAQQPPTGSDQARPPSFRTETDLVQVDTIVQDKSGRFVDDLSMNDFEITEDGRPQRVDQLYLVTEHHETAKAAQWPELGRPAVAPPIQRTVPRVFVVVIDEEHLSSGGFKKARDAAVALFSKEFQQGDIGGVVVNGQMAGKHLTSDREELLKAIQAAKPSSRANRNVLDLRDWPAMNQAEAVAIAQNGYRPEDPVIAEVVRRACTDDPEACRRVDVTPTVIEKAQQLMANFRSASDRTLQVLVALMNGLERMDGRKTILLLSEGFIAEQSWPLVQQAVGLAARANARIYSLDARGLKAPTFSDFAPHDDSLGNLLASFDIGADSINSLAVDTGGFVVRNTNIFDQAVAQIAREAGTYYVLGYRPDRSADGKYRKIAVKVKRAGVIVRARRGYVATPGTLSASAGHPEPVEGVARPEPSPARPEPVEGRAEPATPAPAPVDAAPTPATGTVVSLPTAPATSNLRLRPDAGKHVDALATGAASSAAPDPDATAGWSAYQRGDVETASDRLALAAGRPTARPWVHYALGQARYALGKWADAVREWEQVRTAAPAFEPVYFDLVDGYLQQKEYDKAIHVLRDATARWPSDAETFDALGVVQVTRGALDDAVKSFERAIAIAPNDAVGYFNLGKALEIRYQRSRHYVRQTGTWVANEDDRRNAIANYKRYLDIGGPLEPSAQQGLERLEWTGK